MTHQVFFWLNKNLTEERRAFFEEELKLLPRVSYVSSGRTGRPADTEARPVVDHSFDYSLTLVFPSLKDHEFYQKECPAHRRFMENCRPLFDKVVIYDTEDL